MYELTAYVDLQLAEACMVMNRKLHDEVSEGLHVAGTVHLDCGTETNGARVLATDGVVPQCRCRDGR